MCLPAAAMMAASLAISAVSAIEQQRQTAAAAEAQQATIKQNTAINNAQLQNQLQQQSQQSMQEQSQYAVQSMQEMGRIQAISAESGLSGATDTRIANEAANAADQNMATIEANRMRANEQAHSGGMSSAAQARTQLTSIKQPSSLTAGLQIAGSALNTYTSYQTTQPKSPKNG